MFVDYTGAGVGAEAAVMHHEYTKRLVLITSLFMLVSPRPSQPHTTLAML